MFNVIKNKGNVVRAYQLGRDSAIINELIAGGKIENLGDGNYAEIGRASCRERV